jgi:hypothetical protein
VEALLFAALPAALRQELSATGWVKSEKSALSYLQEPFARREKRESKACLESVNEN